MKKRRLAFLLTFVLSFAWLFGGCDSVNNAVTERFDPTADVYTSYSSVKRYDGAVVACNEEQNIIALKTEERDPSGNNRQTIKVVNALTGAEVLSETEYYSSGDYLDFEVDLGYYPLVAFKTTTTDYDGTGNKTIYDYYVVQESTCNTIANYSEDPIENVDRVEGGLITFTYGEYTYWITEDGKELRKFESSITDGYNLNMNFEAEYNGDLYAWTFDPNNVTLGNRIQVYNSAGVCSVQYTIPLGTAQAKIFVLNNGNIFVQEMKTVVDGGDYDLTYSLGMFDAKMKVSSKIINYQSGEVTELDLDYLVMGVESYYQASKSGSNFAFELKEGQQNQAVIVMYDKKGIAAKYRYVVLDNNMKISFELMNENLAYKNNGWMQTLEWFGAENYIASAKIEANMGNSETYLYEDKVYVCDLLGQVKVELEGSYYFGHTDEYIVTLESILDKDGEVKYEFKNFAAGNEDFDIKISGNNIFVCKTNYVTGCEDVYVMKLEKKELVPVLVSAGIDTEFDVFDGGYAIYDRELGVTSFMSDDGTVLLKLKGEFNVDYDVDYLYDAMVVEDYVNGDPVCYVIK